MIRSARLPKEDARQDLPIMLLEILDAYNLEAGLPLEIYISQELSYGIINIAAPSRLCGIPWAPLQNLCH